MILTNHVIKRLNERYDIKLKHELEAIIFLLELHQYKVIKRDEERKSWLLLIRFKGQNIRLVLNPFNKTIITVLSKNY